MSRRKIREDNVGPTQIDVDVMSRVPFSRIFDSANFANCQDRIAAWRDSFALTVDVCFDDSEIRDFSGAISYHRLGNVLLVQRRYTSHTVIRSRQTIARTGSEKIIFHFFENGGIVGTAGNRNLSVEAGDCFIYDTASTIRIRMLAGQFIGLVIPRRLFRESIGRSTDLHGLTLPSSEPAACIVKPMLKAVADQADRLDTRSSHAFGAALVSMVAASIDTLDDRLEFSPKSPMRLSGTLPIATLTRLLRNIERKAADPAFTPERLAAAFDLSRATLYRKFQGVGGVAGVIRARRATLAFKALTTKDENPPPLSTVALTCGFQNAAEMRRALHSVYGSTPAALRKSACGIETAAEILPSSILIGSLYDDMS